MGSYSFTQRINIYAANAFEVPATLAPTSPNDLLTILLNTSGSGAIFHLVDNTGRVVDRRQPEVPVTVVSCP